MNLTCIGDILDLQISSLLRNELTADWYRLHVGKMSSISATGIIKYELNLITPYNDKLRYYELIISNCVTSYLNDFRSSFENSISLEHRKYLVDKYLNREVVQMICNLANTIVSKDLQWANHKNPEHQKNREVIFILQMVKYNLLWLYLEIKTVTEYLVPMAYRNLETLLAEHFYEYESDISIITEKQ